jgi:endonuclease G
VPGLLMVEPAVRFEEMRRLGGTTQPVAASIDLESMLEARPRVHGAEFFAGRTGFDADFLSDVPVSLPENVGRFKGDEAPLTSGDGHVLHYTNFSVVVSKSRRMALYVACNVDGRSSKQIKRTPDAWFFDERIALEYQLGEDLYTDNALDRGHLVRREDPVWGDQAEQANFDTFHFTNCAPQHGNMNQQTWLGLENYILKNARVHELRVVVFTGPVLREDDPTYRDVQLPKEYWKVVAIRTEDRPSATAYLMSQEKLIEDLEFVFGQYKTYQVAIKEVEALTGLRFGELSRYDGFSNEGVLESAGWRREELRSLADIRI